MECSEQNDLDPEAEEGQIIECAECGSEFEILKADPLSLAPLSTSGDDDGDPDWDD
jgi:lysine biosynthesis protein LysW